MGKLQQPGRSIGWGIDLGGTKVEGVVINFENGEVISRIRIPTEREKGYDHIIGRIAELVDLLKKDSSTLPEFIGIGTPGSIDPETGLMKNSNTTVLNGRTFEKDLKEKLSINLRMTNDANCLALAEANMGAVAEEFPGAGVVFGIILGTGVGGGIVIDGKVWNGRMGIAGEWGHNYLDAQGGDCYCGQVGCVETVIAGPAIERYYTDRSGTTLKLKDIYLRYKKGEKIAVEAINYLLVNFGKAVSSVINVLDPDVIVIGGGVGNIPELYTIGKKHADDYVFNHRMTTPILRPKLGDSAGVFGAALLSDK